MPRPAAHVDRLPLELLGMVAFYLPDRSSLASFYLTDPIFRAAVECMKHAILPSVIHREFPFADTLFPSLEDHYSLTSALQISQRHATLNFLVATILSWKTFTCCPSNFSCGCHERPVNWPAFLRLGLLLLYRISDTAAGRARLALIDTLTERNLAVLVTVLRLARDTVRIGNPQWSTTATQRCRELAVERARDEGEDEVHDGWHVYLECAFEEELLCQGPGLLERILKGRERTYLEGKMRTIQVEEKEGRVRSHGAQVMNALKKTSRYSFAQLSTRSFHEAIYGRRWMLRNKHRYTDLELGHWVGEEGGLGIGSHLYR